MNMRFLIKCNNCGADVAYEDSWLDSLGSKTRVCSEECSHSMKEKYASGIVGQEYYKVCMEHDMPLNGGGECPECRDSNGAAFVLDMQSYYLRPVEKPFFKNR